MFKVLIGLSALLCVVGCGSDGKDGAAGDTGKTGTTGETGTAGNTGTQGVAGKDGAKGIAGVAGKDGIDNRFVASIRCSGVVLIGAWAGTEVDYAAYVTNAGDTMGTAWVRVGAFTQSAARFYSAKQVGALTAAVLIPISDNESAIISVDRSTLVTTVKFYGPSPWVGTFAASACTAQTY